MKSRYNPSRGGHAPGHLRNRFFELVETGENDIDVKGEYPDIAKVSGLLWNCTDIMPGILCHILDLPNGSSYAQGSRSNLNA